METQIKVQCLDDKNHAKILRLGAEGSRYAQELGELICGTSRLYIHKPVKWRPEQRSPIGRCAVCGGDLTFTIEVRDKPAEREEPPAEFEFAGMSLRRTDADDLELARQWTAADPDHAGRVDPAFWCQQSERRQNYLLSDGDGPIYFFTGHLGEDKTLEVNIQFPPIEAMKTVENRHALRGRIMRGLVDGMQWLENRMRGVAVLIRFDSRSPDLIRFCVRKLGFVEEDGALWKVVAPAAVEVEGTD